MEYDRGVVLDHEGVAAGRTTRAGGAGGGVIDRIPRADVARDGLIPNLVFSNFRRGAYRQNFRARTINIDGRWHRCGHRLPGTHGTVPASRQDATIGTDMRAVQVGDHREVKLLEDCTAIVEFGYEVDASGSVRSTEPCSNGWVSGIPGLQRSSHETTSIHEQVVGGIPANFSGLKGLGRRLQRRGNPRPGQPGWAALQMGNKGHI